LYCSFIVFSLQLYCSFADRHFYLFKQYDMTQMESTIAQYQAHTSTMVACLYSLYCWPWEGRAM